MDYGSEDNYMADWGCMWLHGHGHRVRVCRHGLRLRLNTNCYLWHTAPQ